MQPPSEKRSSIPPGEIVEGVDFYREGAAVVFTSNYHLRRGYCCESGCRHCPYGFDPKAGKSDTTPKPKS